MNILVTVLVLFVGLVLVVMLVPYVCIELRRCSRVQGAVLVTIAAVLCASLVVLGVQAVAH